MRSYIIRRLLLIIPTLFLVTIIVFLSVRFIPGSVIDLMVAEMRQFPIPASGLTTSAEYIKHAVGLDVPLYVQYGRWLGILPQPDIGFSGLLQGNLGNSLWELKPILPDIMQRLPVSIELGLVAITTALLIALPIGIYSAVRQDTGLDYIGRTIAILAISIPSFWLGTMVIVYPSIWWGWVPPMEFVPFVKNPVENMQIIILPGMILGMVTSGQTMRMTRTMMLEVLRQDYIRTAWAKGLREWTIIMRHALKNALIPVVTMIGMLLPILIGGSVILETIFNLPGIGIYLVKALNQRDYPVISGVNVVLASFVLIINLIIDLTYGWLDPRISYK